MRVWDIRTGRKQFAFRLDNLSGPQESIPDRQLCEFSHDRGANTRSVAFASNGLLATSSTDRTARVWDISNGKELFRIPHGGPVNCVAFNADGTLRATGSDDKTAQIWRLIGEPTTDPSPGPACARR